MTINNNETVNGLTYEQWMSKVNKICELMIGVSADELTDFCSYDLWEDGCSPKEAALECIENDDIPWLD